MFNQIRWETRSLHSIRHREAHKIPRQRQYGPLDFTTYGLFWQVNGRDRERALDIASWGWPWRRSRRPRSHWHSGHRSRVQHACYTWWIDKSRKYTAAVRQGGTLGPGPRLQVQRRHVSWPVLAGANEPADVHPRRVTIPAHAAPRADSQEGLARDPGPGV